MKLWIHHPATQDGPVPARRWLAYHLAQLLAGWARRLEYFALHHGEDDDEIPF